jgi:hypothetical protein
MTLTPAMFLVDLKSDLEAIGLGADAGLSNPVSSIGAQRTAAQWDLQQPAVRSMKWVGDLGHLESTT